MTTFSFIINFKDENYISQATAPDLKQAIKNRVNNLETKKINYLDEKSKQYMLENTNELLDFLVPIETTKNIWITTLIFKGEIATIHILKTDTTPESEAAEAQYSFVMEFRGGTYISQKTAKNRNKAIKTWANSLNINEIKYLSQKTKKQLIDQIPALINEEKIIPINKNQNTWALEYHFKTGIANIYIFKTTVNS